MTTPHESPSRADAREVLLSRCESAIGYVFKDKDLLRRCLTHSSSANTRLDSNERLEFLGDAVLGMVICEHLYDRYPDHREGQLTQQKSHLVSRAVCGKVADELGLPDVIFVGKGLSKIPNSVRAAALEAIIAGVYIDGGISAARDFIFRTFEAELSSTVAGEMENYKSLLQEEVQKSSNCPPSYIVVDEQGPDHNRVFVVAAQVDGRQFESATGNNKKQAEQRAAKKALEHLLGQPFDTLGETEHTNDRTLRDSNMKTIECRILFRPETDQLRFLPEGPYTVNDDTMSWVGIQHGADSVVGSLNLLSLSSATNQSFDLPGRPGFAFPTETPNVFVAGVERTIGLFNTEDQTWRELKTNIDSLVENTIINDGMVFEDNLIFGCKELEFTTPKAGLYLWRGKDGQLVRLRDDQICSNGKAISQTSAGELRLIDIDSPSKQITSSRLDIDAGTLTDTQVVVDLSSEDVFPDGMILTPDGQSLIVALYDPGDPDAGAARQYSLVSGELEAVWTCPGSPRVTCPQLVKTNQGINLVLTTAVEHMPTEQQNRHSNAGCLFVGETEFSEIGEQPKFQLPKGCAMQ